jgi:hypothetical protein
VSGNSGGGEEALELGYAGPLWLRAEAMVLFACIGHGVLGRDVRRIEKNEQKDGDR